MKFSALSANRNYGVDLLRCLAMFMVIILHIFNQGLISSYSHGANFYISYLSEALTYCATDVFALVTGYVYITSRFKPARIFTLWSQVFLYSVLISVILKVKAPELISNNDLISSFFPVTSQRYWYFSAYFGLFFLIPFINKLLNSLSQKQFSGLVVVLISLFSLLSLYFDAFSIAFGYHLVWLIIMYILGAYIKKYNVGKGYKNRYNLELFFFSSFITFISYCVLKFIHLFVDFNGFDDSILYKYTSPTVLLSAVFLSLYFKNLNFKSNGIKKVISLISPMAFGVYIIHTHPVAFDKLLRGQLTNFANFAPLKLIASVFLLACAIYISCSVADFLRIQIFKLLKINKLSELIANKLLKLYRKLVNLLSLVSKEKQKEKETATTE